MKKYNYCLMNPPFSEGKKLLYPAFFEKALNIADTVAVIMPMNLESNHDKLRFHNRRVHKHQLSEPENVNDYFPDIGVKNISFLLASKSQNNPVPEYKDPLDSMKLLYPKRDRMKPLKGDTQTAMRTNEDDNGTPVLFKVFKNDVLETVNFSDDVVNSSNKWSDAPYLVIVNGTPSLGRFNCVIHNNTKEQMTWSMWVYVFEAKSKAEAKRIKEWLQSDTIKEEVIKMINVKKVQSHTVSLTMLKRLPTYE